jgi:hypothetical protein
MVGSDEMDAHDPDAREQFHSASQENLLVRTLSPRQLAVLIRSLDSRLTNIDYEQSADQPVLVYTFEVAGKSQTFRLVVRPESIESIIELYPEAAVWEQELLRQFGLVFRPPKD